MHLIFGVTTQEVGVLRQKGTPSGIYLLPNLLTTASLFSAFYSVVASLKAQYEVAVIAIVIGMIADTLDGRIARMTNTQTAFGAEYDSLSDMVTFGVAPSLLLYSWGLHQFGKVGWLIAFTYTAAVALRLARFNTQIGTADKRYFQGLPCPPSAAVVSSFVWVCQRYENSSSIVFMVAACLSVALAILMVSNVRYYSFKDFEPKGKVPFLYILLIVVCFVAIASNPSVLLLLGSVVFAFSGPVQTLVALHRMRKIRRKKEKKRKTI